MRTIDQSQPSLVQEEFAEKGEDLVPAEEEVLKQKEELLLEKEEEEESADGEEKKEECLLQAVLRIRARSDLNILAGSRYTVECWIQEIVSRIRSGFGR